MGCKNVYIKRFLRQIGIDPKYDWPAQMTQVRNDQDEKSESD